MTTDAQRSAAENAPTPPSVEAISATPREQLDDVLRGLQIRAHVWSALGVSARIALLDELLETTLAAAEDWVAVAARAKGIDPNSPLVGEDWGSGPVVVLRNLALLRRTLLAIEETGRPQPSVTTRDDGQVAVEVMPAQPLDRLLFPGYTAETRLQRGVTEDRALERMGRIYRDTYDPSPAVALVLGAGNVSSIGPMDALYQLFALDRVVVLKMSPVNQMLGPHIGEAFEPLVREGFLRIVYGDVEVGDYLANHDEVDAIHVTGSDRTYEAIVFGSGEDGRARKAAGTPVNDREITAELGNVTPVIVVPGPWSQGDLNFHGHNLASMLVHNAGFNCVTARVIVQHRAWSQRRGLLEAVRASLRQAQPRTAYYPGAAERWQRFINTYGHAERFGPWHDPEELEEPDERLPFTFIPELEPDSDDLAFRTEAFCSVMGEVALDTSRSIPDYLDAAVRFCNERLWGNLAVTLLVHPRSMKDPQIADAVERALDQLRYGTVVLNHFAGAAYAFVSPPWGAYPGGTPQRIGSGTGVVHNTYLLEDVEKTVVKGPFRPPLTPLWFHTNAALAKVGPELAQVVAHGSAGALPKLLWGALRG